jgi:methylmalonyl-CoA mutase N-terminal domain/subunit
MKERFKAKDPRSWMLRFHTQTAGSMLTAQQPENNVVRVTLQALAAVLGGTQSLHTNSRDEALALPTEESVLLALRTQQLIAYESGVCNTVDPLAGSYYVEGLTDRIEQEALALMARIDGMGGMVAAIEAGFPQRQIEDSSYEYQSQIETGDRVIVGVNKFQAKERVSPAVFRVPKEIERAQVGRVQAVRAGRDAAAVAASLQALGEAARGSANLMPPILGAVKAYATLGEICGVLRGVFGTYKDAGAAR